jgi:hypothetical protein
VLRLGVPPTLARTLRSTNSIVISSRSYHCSSRPRRGDLVSLCA